MPTAPGPLASLLDLRERMNQLFDELVHPVEPTGTQIVWTPVADVLESPDGFIIYIELAGVDPATLQFEVEGSTLGVRGVRPYPSDAEMVHRIERHYGTFGRAFDLPARLDAATLTHTCADGILRIFVKRA